MKRSFFNPCKTDPISQASVEWVMHKEQADSMAEVIICFRPTEQFTEQHRLRALLDIIERDSKLRDQIDLLGVRGKGNAIVKLPKSCVPLLWDCLKNNNLCQKTFADDAARLHAPLEIGERSIS